MNLREISLLSTILYKVYSIKDIYEMRKAFLELIPNLVMCRKATFYLSSSDGSHFMDDPVGYKMSNELLNKYMEYEQYDYMNCIFSNTKTEVYRESDYVIDTIREDSPYYRDLIVPNDMYYSVQIPLYYDNSFLGIFNLFRGKQDNDFSDDDIFLLRMIKDHVALRLYNEYSKNDEDSIPYDLVLISKKYNLSERETEVLRHLLAGESNGEMSDNLNISQFTVQKHISNIYRKFEISSRGQLLNIVMNKEKN